MNDVGSGVGAGAADTDEHWDCDDVVGVVGVVDIVAVDAARMIVVC